MNLKVTALLPAFNEEKSVSEVIKRCKRYVDEVIVINDGSKDKTEEIAENSGAVVFSHITNFGVGTAIQTGIKIALKRNADVIVTLDSDGQHDPCYIPVMVEMITKNGSDLVIGSRFLKRSRTYEMPFTKKLGNIAYSTLLSIFTQSRLTDTQSGLRALSKTVAENLFLKCPFSYTHEMIINASNKGFVVTEIPVVTFSRRHGNSRVTKSLIKYNLNTFSILLKSFFESFSLGVMERRKVHVNGGNGKHRNLARNYAHSGQKEKVSMSSVTPLHDNASDSVADQLHNLLVES